MDIQIEKAEQQLIGFIHAKQGYDLLSLITDMGLTKKEWESIKRIGMSIPDDMKVEIDQYFENEKIKRIAADEMKFGNRAWD